MSFKTSIVCKNIETYVAYKHLDAFVDFSVGCQIHRRCKRLPTHLADEWLSFIMIASMNCKNQINKSTIMHKKHSICTKREYKNEIILTNKLIFECKHFAAYVASVHAWRWHSCRIIVHSSCYTSGCCTVIGHV